MEGSNGIDEFYYRSQSLDIAQTQSHAVCVIKKIACVWLEVWSNILTGHTARGPC